eukprot:1122857-Rhodomonas_salina.2
MRAISCWRPSGFAGAGTPRIKHNKSHWRLCSWPTHIGVGIGVLTQRYADTRRTCILSFIWTGLSSSIAVGGFICDALPTIIKDVVAVLEFALVVAKLTSTVALSYLDTAEAKVCNVG